MTVRNKFYTLQETSERYTIDNEYEYFINAHVEAAHQSNQEPNVEFRESQ